MSPAIRIYCPSGSGRECPTRSRCLTVHACNFQTAEGGRTFDSEVHEAPQAPRFPSMYRPDFGIEHERAPFWMSRIPAMRRIAAFCAAAIAIFYIAGFVLRTIHQV